LPTARNGTGSASVDALSNNCVEVDFANATGYKSFRVSITNNYNRFGDALMQVAEVELLGTFVPAPPVWVRQPEPTVLAYVGSSPVFAAKASGLGSLAPKYQWYRNNTIIPGATGTAYTLANAQLTDTGASFTCTASNSFGTITSSAGVLSVITPPTQPYPAAVLADSPMAYWRLNEGPDNGAGNNGAVAHDYRGGHNGSYSNVVLGATGYNPTSDPDPA